MFLTIAGMRIQNSHNPTWAHEIISTLTSPHITSISIHISAFFNWFNPELDLVGWEAIDCWIPPRLERLECRCNERCSASPGFVIGIEDVVMRLIKVVGRDLLVIKPGW